MTAPSKPAEEPRIPPPSVPIESKPPETPQVLEQPPQLPGPPKPPRKRRARPRPLPAATPVEQPPAAPSSVAPVEPPVQLTPLLSETDQRAYAATIADLLSKTGRNLAAAESRGPSPQQRQLMEQARRFVSQCLEVRGKDLPAAKSLAERAEIISREVLAQFK